MGSLKTLALASALLTGATAVASAADLRHQPLGLPPAPIAAPIAEVSGWYLRGDIGFGVIEGTPTITNAPGFPTNPPTVNGHNASFGNYGVIGVGAGYQWNSWLRTDITVDYRTKADMKFGDKYCFASGAAGTIISAAGSTCAAAPAGSTFAQNGFNAYTGRISAMSFLANGYLDLGTWYGLTPFVGAGVGFANIKVDGLSDQGYNQNLLAGGAVNPVAPAYYGSKSKTNFAWALMAGVGYDVNERLKLELGYRYLNMGDIKGITGCGNPTCGIIGVKELDAHEFRLGMRWMLGGPSYAAAPAPIPYPAHVTKKF